MADPKGPQKRLLKAVTPPPDAADVENPQLPTAPGDEIVPKAMERYLHPARWVISDPKCLTCKAFKNRNSLPNGALVCASIMRGFMLGAPLGFDVPTILREITPLMADWEPEDRISYQSIGRHRKNHLNTKDAAHVEIVLKEQYKALAGADKELTRVLTPFMIINKGLTDAWELMEQGMLQVTSVGEAVALMRFDQELKDKGTEDQTLAAFFTEWAYASEAMRRVMPPELYKRFQDELASIKRQPKQIEAGGTKRAAEGDPLEAEAGQWKRGERLSSGEEFDDVID